MGHVAAHIFKRAIERQRKQCCCCCDCEQHQKPKRFVVSEYYGTWVVRNANNQEMQAWHIRTREAAERIAAIYEETTP